MFIACLGDAEAVQHLQRDTGVKDKTAQFWINLVHQKAVEQHRARTTDPKTKDERLKGKLTKEERDDIKLEIKKQIQTEVYAWLLQQPPDRFQALPVNSRKPSYL